MGEKIIDAHIHGFPDKLFRAIWKYFDLNYWHVREKLTFDDIAQFLPKQGVDGFTILNYAHKPDISRDLNDWTYSMGKKYPSSIPFGTIHARDSNFNEEVERVLSPEYLDLHGIKLQLMVTDFDPDDSALDYMYETLIQFDKILVLHAGTGPVTDMILNKKLDLSKHVGIDKLRPVMERFPMLKLQIPHLGCMQTNEFFDFALDFPQVYLDTSMALEFLFEENRFSTDLDIAFDRFIELQDKILFGSDFPNIPHSYLTSIKSVNKLPVSGEIRQKIYYKNAEKFYRL